MFSAQYIWLAYPSLLRIVRFCLFVSLSISMITSEQPLTVSIACMVLPLDPCTVCPANVGTRTSFTSSPYANLALVLSLPSSSFLPTPSVSSIISFTGVLTFSLCLTTTYYLVSSVVAGVQKRVMCCLFLIQLINDCI